jgi:predicted small lipoprotein YifL
MYRALFFIGITLLLTACGKKGNLLPPQSPTKTSVTPYSTHFNSAEQS